MEENMQQGNANNFWLNFSTYFLNKSFVKLHNIFSNELMFVTIFFSVSTMIGNLRNMATDMGTEVQNQNSQLDRINLKVMIFFLLALIFVSFLKKKDLFQERFYYDITINSWSNLENSKDIYLLNKIARSAKHIIIFILKEEGMILLQLCILSNYQKF